MMVPPAILHIGTHKSGSSTIQAFLMDNRTRLGEVGINIPSLRSDDVSAKAHSEFVKNLKDESLIESMKSVVQCVGNEKYKTTIVSSENFYNGITPETLKRLRLIFLLNTRIVCYFRDPIDHAVSFYVQHLKGKKKHAGSLLDFLGNQTRDLSQDRSFGYYRYDANMATWRSHFPDVQIRRYARMTGADLISRFFEDAGLESFDLSIFDIPADCNVTGSLETARVVLELNRMASRQSISPKMRNALTKSALRRDADCRDAIGPRITWRTIDTGEFVDAFRAHNPGFLTAYPQVALPRSVSFPDVIDMDEAELIDVVTSLEEPLSRKS
jgi:hypothetical protein